MNKEVNLIPALGKGLQKYDFKDYETVDPFNTVEIFKDEILPHLIEYFSRDDSLLDVGCGNGRLSYFLCDKVKNIEAIDVFREINPFYLTNNINFTKGSLLELKNDKKFNIIFMFGVFYLQENWGFDQTLNKIDELLLKGGKVIIIDDARRDNKYVDYKNLPHGMYNIKQMFEQKNMKIVKDVIQKNGIHRITVIKK